MLWLSNKINDLVSHINPKDIAFLLASSLEINKAKRSKLKAQVALNCLSGRKSFSNYILEFYFKDSSNKLRLAALNGGGGNVGVNNVGRSIHNNSIVYKVFNNKKVYF